MMKTVLTNSIGLLLILALTGCTPVKKTVFQEKLPAIAHVHIGHAITGWKQTPDKKGLLQTAEKEASIALAHAEYAVEKPDELVLIKLHVAHVMHAVNPESRKDGPGTGFGLKKAVTEAIGHITFAADSDDASENVRNFAEPFAVNAKAVLERSDLIEVLGEEVLQTVSAQEAFALTGEILNLARANVEGVDTDGDGAIGADPREYGLKQLRAQIMAMTNNEDPPYRPVARRYLFGLIRLPGGKWAFSWLVDRFYDPEGGGGGSY